MDYVLIIVGFVILAVSADALVNGASALAKQFRISNLVIGLTVVAFGTSAPELVVNLIASANGTSEIALTNILGSNAINTFVILGISALICAIPAQASSIRFDIPLSILAGVLVFFMGTDFASSNEAFKGISRWDAAILLLVFVLFTIHSVKTAHDTVEIPDDVKPIKKPWALLLILGGLCGLVLGGNWIVKSAVRIAASWGVSEAVIGVTIVALGTSLPELATSAVAAIRGNTDLAIGNVIGSNIFNVFFVLAVSGLIRPLPGYANIGMDALMATLSSLLLWLFVFIGKKHSINRWQGGLLLLIYIAYLFWLI